jgi:hypothetical protein
VLSEWILLGVLFTECSSPATVKAMPIYFDEECFSVHTVLLGAEVFLLYFEKGCKVLVFELICRKAYFTSFSIHIGNGRRNLESQKYHFWVYVYNLYSIRVNVGYFDFTKASVNCKIGSEVFHFYDKFFD